MRFGAALDLWSKGDPDAPVPPPPPTELDEALTELGDTCAALGLKPTDLSARFFALEKVVPRKATPEQVRAFVKTLLDEAEAA
jgi:hypothetical protein